MSETSTWKDIFEYSIKVLPIIVAIISLRIGWFSYIDRLCNKRMIMSKFSKDLYEQTKDKNVEKLSIEYGYAALTSDINLTLAERKVLISIRNPLENIRFYVRGQHFLSINTNKKRITWKNDNYYNRWYRWFIKSLFFLSYIFCCGILSTALNIDKIQIPYTSVNIDQISYFFTISLIFVPAAFWFLNIGSQLSPAEKIMSEQ